MKGEKEESEKERKCTNWHLYTKKSNSLGPCFALGEKGKQKSASRKRAERSVVWPLFPAQTTAALASLADIFPI